MTGLLSGISGNLLQKVALSTLLPVVVFVLLLQTPVIPIPAQDWALFRAVAELEPGWRVVATTLLTVLLAALLYVLNNPIIRLYEGYPWKSSWVGKWQIRRHRKRLEEAQMREKVLRHLRRALSKNDERIEALGAWEADLGRSIFGAYPKAESVLPTRLGNVIRSFENYPQRQYRMSGITMWPRLVAKIPKEFGESMDEAKLRFDFMINGSFLSLLLATILLAQALARPAPVSAMDWWLWLGKFLGCLGLGFLFYEGSISRAVAWGVTVKSAFDLYRLELLAELGFRQTPASLVEERKLWNEIRLQMQFGDPADAPPNLRYVAGSPPPTYARGGDLDSGSFEISRGAGPAEGGEAVRIFVRVKNVDADNRDADHVEVVDTVPEGFDYRWDSARLDDKTVRATGVNPYRFAVGKLKHGGEVTLSYLAGRRELRRALPEEEP